MISFAKQKYDQVFKGENRREIVGDNLSRPMNEVSEN